MFFKSSSVRVNNYVIEHYLCVIKNANKNVQYLLQNTIEEHIKYTKNERSENTNTEQDDESEDERFWKQPSYHTPEDRVAIAERFMKKQEKKNSLDKSNQPQRVLKLFAPDGRAYNINQAKVPFKLNDEDDSNFVVLEVSVYR